jgi:hypothetical protein
MPRMDRELAKFVVCRILMQLPSCSLEKTDITLPRRTAARVDSVLDICR